MQSLSNLSSLKDLHFFGNGTITLSFQSAGTVSVFQTLLHSSVKVATIVLPPAFISSVCMPSIPAAFPFFRLLIALLTSLWVIGAVSVSNWITSSLLKSCVITGSDGGLLRLHEADEAAVDWLITYGS